VTCSHSDGCAYHKIKSGHIGDAVRPRLDDKECCPYLKSNPGILMMETAEDRATDNIPDPLGTARDRGILVQRQVRARAVVVAHVREQHVAQMTFAEDHDMINAFPADRSDQPFCISVLPR
jgi:hypothetical protein